MTKYEKGKIVKGTVSGITNYGIFVKIDDCYSGLIHISEISSGYVRNPNDFAKINDVIDVEILDIDNHKDQIKLSIKNIEYKKNKVMIKETKHGFKTLEYQLPIWIEEALNSQKQVENN